MPSEKEQPKFGRRLADELNRFFDSADGKAMMDRSILKDPDQAEYLKSRLTHTFIAGACWGCKEKRTSQTKPKGGRR